MSAVEQGCSPAPSSPDLVADEVRLVATAVAACLGAFAGLRLPAETADLAAVGFVITAAVVVVRTPAAGVGRTIAGVVFVLGLACARGGSAARAYEPLEIQAVRTEAVVRGDPEPVGIGWRAELRLDSGDRLEATAFGRAGFVVRRLEVGDRVVVAGRIGTIGDRPWLRARHIVGRLSVDKVVVVAPASGFDRLVNELRSVVVDGASSFDDQDRPLYTGLVIGDDRFQSLSQQARFRASGLTHLLAVSGQNVAFVLLVARPLLALFGRRARLVVILGVLVLFTAMTRAEPSVLRASSAAAVATWALVAGRIGSGLRTLSVGVTGLVLVDPFLLDVVGFQLSVAASVGIIVVSPLVLARLPGAAMGAPGLRAPAQALALTVGAQAGVAPLLVHHFGPLPLASIPANLVAGWAAGVVMTLGLTTGPVGGLLHRARFPAAAAFLQWPSRVLVGWVDATARWAADLGLPRLDMASLAAVGVLGLVIALRPRRPLPGRAVVAASLAAGVIVTMSATVPVPDRPSVVADGVLYIPSVASGDDTVGVLVVRDPRSSAVDAVLASRVGPIDVLITERGDAMAARIVDALIEVTHPALVLAPPRHRIRGATRVTEPLAVTTGWGAVEVEPEPAGAGLVVAVPAAAEPAVWEAADPGR